MAVIKCGEQNSSGGSAGFVVYSDVLVKAISKLTEQLLADAGINKIIDGERLRDALLDLRTKRKDLIKIKARIKLGKHEGLMSYSGSQDFFDAEEFRSSMHPMGVIMEAALKAAAGNTTPAPEGTIDDRLWYVPRRFVVELQEEKLIIDESEMEDDIRKLVVSSRRHRSIMNIMSSVMDARSKNRSDYDALMAFEQAIAREVQREAETKRGAGRIKGVCIEIITTRHANEASPSSRLVETENRVARSIMDAIDKRVAMRLEALVWSNSSPMSYVVNLT